MLQRSSLQDMSQGGDDHWYAQGPNLHNHMWHGIHNIATIRGEQCTTLSPDDPENNPNPPADARDGRAARDMICFNHL